MRILIYRLGSLGDTVLALPCFHLIRATYPDAEIIILTNSPVSGKAAPLEAIIASTGLIDGVIHYPVGLRDPRQLLALRSQIRAQKFDLAISLTAARGLAASLRDLLFFRACGIRRTVGIPLRRQDLVCSLRPGGKFYESEAERLLRRIRPIGHADLQERRWLDLRLTADEKTEANRLLVDASLRGRFIVASLGTKSPANDWGASNWTQLLAKLSAVHPELGIVLLGSHDEAEKSESVLEGWHGPRANLCGKTSPRVGAALLEQAALYVGHDSGPMHLAAAAGAPCVAIFSARCPPGQWFPVGVGHLLLYPLTFYKPERTADLAYQRQALASIRVEDVLAAITRLLK